MHGGKTKSGFGSINITAVFFLKKQVSKSWQE
jgi:hypothetical protein